MSGDLIDQPNNALLGESCYTLKQIGWSLVRRIVFIVKFRDRGSFSRLTRSSFVLVSRKEESGVPVAVHALGLRNEKARKRIFMGCAVVVGEVGEVGDVGDCTLSVELEMLPDERRRDSSIVSCKLTLA